MKLTISEGFIEVDEFYLFGEDEVTVPEDGFRFFVGPDFKWLYVVDGNNIVNSIWNAQHIVTINFKETA